MEAGYQGETRKRLLQWPRQGETEAGSRAVVVEEGRRDGFQVNSEVEPKGLAVGLDVGFESKRSQGVWPGREHPQILPGRLDLEV